MSPNKGVQGTLHKVSGPLTPDVRIKESALKMTTRVTSGNLSTGNARREPPYRAKNRYFSATTLLRRQNGLEMREKPIQMGYSEEFSRISEHFFQLLTFLAGKQPRFRTRGCNLRPTSCRLCTPPRPLHTDLVLSVGRS